MATVPDVSGRDISRTVPTAMVPRVECPGCTGDPAEHPTPPPGPAPEVVSRNPKDIIGDTKPQMWLVPAVLGIEVARVMADGARKYGPYNWRQNPVLMSVYISAMERHLAALKDGENLTRDSKVKHLAAIAANAGLLLDAQATGNLIDDRPHGGPAGDLLEEYTEQAA